MSLSTLTNDLARPGDVQYAEAIAIENAPNAAKPAKSGTKKAFDALAKFIPVEILAPYLMVMDLIVKNTVNWEPKTILFIFVAITPFLLFLFEYSKSASANVAWPQFSQVLWRAIASAIAFTVWSLSVPGNPYLDQVGGIAVAGLLAVIVSPILSAVDEIVLKLLSP